MSNIVLAYSETTLSIKYIQWIKQAHPELTFELVGCQEILTNSASYKQSQVYVLQPDSRFNTDFLLKGITIVNSIEPDFHPDELNIFKSICRSRKWNYIDDPVLKAHLEVSKNKILPRPKGKTAKEWALYTREIRRFKGADKSDDRAARISIASFKRVFPLTTYPRHDLWVIQAQTSQFQCIADRCAGKCSALILYDNLRFQTFISDDLIQETNIDAFCDLWKIHSEKSGPYLILETFGNPSLKSIIELVEGTIRFLIKESGKPRWLSPLKDQSQGEIYSRHIFIFPFTFQGMLTNEEWREITSPKLPKELDTNHYPTYKEWLLRYNTRNYFTKPMQSFIFSKDITFKRIYQPGIVKEYVVTISDSKEYYLEIDQIEFQSLAVDQDSPGDKDQLGILTINCKNTKQEQSAPSDILAINQYGRRLFLPFLANNFAGLKLDPPVQSTDFAHDTALASKGKLAPSSLHIAGKEHPVGMYEEKYGMDSLLFKDIFRGLKSITPIIDDRMFTLSWYGNDEITQELMKPSVEEGYLSHSWWYQYVYVDSPGEKSVANDVLQSQLIKTATYPRWIGNGLYYGMTRYSHVCLTPSWPALKRNENLYLIDHLETLYTEITKLCLIQYAFVLQLLEDFHTVNITDIEKRYNRYLRYKKELSLEIVTVQDQGIEIYQQLRSGLELDKLESKLHMAVQQAFDYDRNQKIATETNRIAFLTIMIAVITTVIIFPTFLVGLLDMSIFEVEVESFLDGIWANSLVGFIVFLALVMAVSLLVGGYWIRLLIKKTKQ